MLGNSDNKTVLYTILPIILADNYVSILVISYIFIEYDLYGSYSSYWMLYMHNWNIISSKMNTHKILPKPLLKFPETSNSTNITVYNVVIGIIQCQIILISWYLVSTIKTRNIDDIYVIIFVYVIQFNDVWYQRKNSQHSMLSNIDSKTFLTYNFDQ